MAAIYKALSALLSYPTAELQEAMPEIAAAVQAEMPGPVACKLATLAAELQHGDLLDMQARYVDLFDRSRSLSLNLFEHVHGESRDRGQAMVSLRERYRAAGFDIAANELPDYLPLYLEFLSLVPPHVACAGLAEAAHVLHALAERLNKRDGAYASVFEALEILARQAPDAALLAGLRAASADDPSDLAALDRAWEEAEVRFGPGNAKDGCPRAARSIRKPAEVNPS